MTIEECKHKLVRVEMKIKDPSERKALFMAINSLIAWKKVEAELDYKKRRIIVVNDFDTGERSGLWSAAEVVNRHIAKLEANHETT